ncbi:Esa1p-associated factor [Tilletia horrida]|uniref:Chromatin modification-related protein EAF3 n=1 Tax=Tilletia horrida TaxID=155126 RepID=A0AAN6GS32_9BASI|nr:Esa1p-associated factor [Tilletia horrida]KAK0554831.1 Esa1p-associated factor [Tilletia horrida]KAK0568177.1 Esa1p-associated factor [Tilletia horrida]
MQFKVGEKVLCFHGPLLYGAKILKAENRTADEGAQIEAAATQEGYVVTTSQAGPFYFVHYQGWKQTWDEWVPETRLMKFNEDNIQFSKSLVESYKSDARAAKSKQVATRVDDSVMSGADDSVDGGANGAVAGGAGTRGGGADTGAAGGSSARAGARKDGAAAGAGHSNRGAKRTREIAEQEEEYVKRPEIKIPIPEPLKIILVDDWERVTKNSQLVQLPRKPCVQQVLDDYKAHYIKHRKGAKRTNATTLGEVLDGLRLYFDKSLTHNLLYRFERLQYTDFRKAWMTGQEKDGYNVTGPEFQSGLKSKTDEEVAKEQGKGKAKEVVVGGEAGGPGGNAADAAAAKAGAGQTANGGGASASGKAATPTPGSRSKATSALGIPASLSDATGTSIRQREELMEPSRIYGAEHLLRLFVNLPALVAHTTLDSESIQILKDHLNEFMTYMTRERDRIFVKEYEPASSEYHRLSAI